MSADRWAAWQFVLGEWTGEGGGQPGEGAGGFTLYPELDGQILVRRNRVDYPATTATPAASHEDLMVVYAEADGSLRADYWDCEGHVIHYAVEVRPDEGMIRLVSEPNPAAPRFRFVYRKIDEQHVETAFEIAPPGQPEAFSTYVEGRARRREGKP